MCIYPDAILVTLCFSEPFVSLQTYDEKHGQSQRFFLSKRAIQSQLEDDAEGSFVETDLLNYCTVSRSGNSIRFNMCWLHGNYDGDVSGYRQTFFVPVNKAAMVLGGESIKHLSYQPVHQPKADIFFTKTAHAAIAAAKDDKLKLHALKRVFRDNFNYGSDEHLVIQIDEFVHGFYFFSTVSGYEGGIVPHETEVKGKDSMQHRKVFFGIHT